MPKENSQICPTCGTPVLRDTPLSSIFIDEAALVGALVNALDGKEIVVAHEALKDPITVTLHLK